MPGSGGSGSRAGGSWGTIPYGGGGGSNTEHGTIYTCIVEKQKTPKDPGSACRFEEPLHIRDAVPVRPWIGQHRGQVAAWRSFRGGWGTWDAWVFVS